MEKVYLILSILLMLPGLVGIFIPILPGIPYMFLISLIYGLVTRFQTLGNSEVIALGIIALLSFIVDYSTGLIGAKYGGASNKSITYGLLGSVIGTIILPPFGGILGLIIAVFFSEIMIHNNKKKATKATSGALFGSLLGIIFNFLLAITFLVLFTIFAVR